MPSGASRVDRVPGGWLEGTRYRLIRPLEPRADPETGHVWSATDADRGGELVVKIVSLEHPDCEPLARRIASVRGRVGGSHARWATLVDIGVTQAREPFFVYEALSGRTLRGEIDAGGALAAPRALDIVAQALEGLDAAHRARVVHGDLRGEKIFVCSGGAVKLLGFGTLPGDRGEPAIAPPHHRVVGAASAYVAPEVVMGHAPTCASDVFAMGVILYEALTGRLPFAVSTSDPSAVSPPSVVAKQPIPGDLDAAVMRAIARDADERFGSAGAFAAALAPIVARLFAQAAMDTTDRDPGSHGETKWTSEPRRPRPLLAEDTHELAADGDRRAENVYTIAPGSVIAGKYLVVRIIGKGGMGLVVEAKHLQLDRRVAIKLLLPEFMAYAEAAGRFLREARAASRLTSQHVTRVLDVGTLESGEPYMVMEYLAGQDLAYHARASTPLTIGEAIDYVTQACDAIAEAHKLGIVHRDLKPANLFLTKRADGSPLIKVLDFGISKVVGEGSGDIALTQTTTILGSALYMSPEQMRSAKSVDQRTDVYALGVCLFELLARELPYFAQSFPELCAKVFTSPPRRLGELRGDVPAGLEEVVERSLARDADERFQSVPDLVRALSPYARLDTRARMEKLLRQHAPLSTLLPPADMTAPRASPARRLRSAREAPPAAPRYGLRVLFALVAIALGAGAALFSFRTPTRNAESGATQRTEVPEPPAPTSPVSPQASLTTEPARATPLDAPSVSNLASSASAAPGAPTSSASAEPTAAPSAHASAVAAASAAPRSKPSVRSSRSDGMGQPGPALLPDGPVTPSPPVNSDLGEEKCFATMPDGTRKQVPCH